MRRREEHRVTGAQSGRVRRAETKVAITAQLWKQGVGTTPIFLARGQYGDLCVRVLCEQPQEFGAGITRAADNTDLDHGEPRSEEHTSELQSLMRISYAVFCLKKKKTKLTTYTIT